MEAGYDIERVPNNILHERVNGALIHFNENRIDQRTLSILPIHEKILKAE